MLCITYTTPRLPAASHRRTMSSRVALLLAGALAFVAVSAGPLDTSHGGAVQHHQRHFEYARDVAHLDPRPVMGSPPSGKPSWLTPTDSTFFNHAQTPGADPYVMYDAPSGYYVS